MRRSRIRAAFVLAVVALIVGAVVPSASSTSSKHTTATADPLAVLRSTANDIGMGDPDLPPVGRHIDRATYLALRSQQIAMYRGAPFPTTYNARQVAIDKFQRQLAHRTKTGPTWTAIGPAPIPNGQTSPLSTVSGRVTAIAVDPTDANVVYVGTAQGGVYRSTDGGTHWTPLMDDEDSLAVGALAIPTTDNTVLYVGSGEGNLSGDSYAGVGLYRINGANGATPVVNGPFEARIPGTGTGAGNGHAFQFMAIQGIAVDPANAARVYVSVTPGGIGIGNEWELGASAAADPGLYLTTNGTAGTPQFSKVAGSLPQTNTGTGFFPASTDVSFMPGSSTTLLVGIEDVGFNTSANNGIWRSTNADQATPSFTHISLPDTVFNTRIATGPSNTAIVGAETNLNPSGHLYKSTNSGATFPTTLTAATGFCGGQCFYDMAPAIDPSNASKMLVGGSADNDPNPQPNILVRSTNGGTSFPSSDGGLHADSHATEYAPSNPSIVYAGNDGGIFRSGDGGATWTSKNNTGFSATQFQSLAVHPTDPNFTIGGTQDNGTEWYKPNGTWTRADFGDGGFARIDQTSTSTTSLTMYHTYFNQKNNVIGFARVTATSNAHDNGWAFFGCGGTSNGISCTDDPLFYAPLELGPVTGASGSHQTVYFGTQRLYRSVNQGGTMNVVSQSLPGGFFGRISAIAIAPGDDDVRIIGGSGGQLLGTESGSSPLDNIDNSNQIPNSYVARVVIDPTNANIAYVAIGGFQGGTSAGDSHVWKTTNINGTSTSWTAVNTGLPDVPVNAMVIDPIDHTHLFVGTDIGVYESTDSGAHWAPFGTGLPVVPIFDMAIAQPGTGSEVLRVATHGRGMYEASIGSGGATLTVHKAGAGGGTVTSDDGHINCGGSCSFVYTPGDTVVLTASPNASSTFGGWTNCDSPAGTQCTQTVNANETVTATFDSNDTTKPTAKMLKPAKTLQFSTSIALQWSGTDSGGSGLDDFTIKVKKAAATGTFGAFTNVTGLVHTSLTSKTVSFPAGFTYCFAAQSRDNAGNPSNLSATKCTELPVDDKAMPVGSGTWSRKTGLSGPYARTLSTSTQHNATLKLNGVKAKRVGIAYRTCSGCGQVEVLFGSTNLGFVDLTPNSACPTNVICFAFANAFSTVKTGNVTFRVRTTGKKVQVDALLANLNANPTFFTSGAQGRVAPLQH